MSPETICEQSRETRIIPPKDSKSIFRPNPLLFAIPE